MHNKKQLYTTCWREHKYENKKKSQISLAEVSSEKFSIVLCSSQLTMELIAHLKGRNDLF